MATFELPMCNAAEPEGSDNQCLHVSTVNICSQDATKVESGAFVLGGEEILLLMANGFAKH